MTIDADILAILACPEDKGPLYYFEEEGFFYNPRLRLKYPIEDGIPVLLVKKAITLPGEEHEKIMKLVKERNMTLNFEQNS